MLWTYQNQIVEEIPEGYIGFVYLITNLKTGQKYIGKKLAQFKRTKPPLKGKKLKRRSTVESDWREYWGSSDRLNADAPSGRLVYVRAPDYGRGLVQGFLPILFHRTLLVA